jgi:LysR family transcriptional regulator, glycine cleavage system transcriptional activator
LIFPVWGVVHGGFTMPVVPQDRRSASSPPQTLPPFAQLRAFEAVGRLGGVRRAAQAMGLDHAVVSRHLRALEDWAGTQLIDRARGNPVLTAEGARFHARITAAIGELQQASAELVRRNEPGVLKIWCVPGLASEWLTSRLDLFQAANPGLGIELHPTDTSPDFSRYEADVDIRYINGHAPISAMRITGGVRRFEISRPAVLAVASPACAATMRPVMTPADLLSAPLLHEESCAQWRAWFNAHGVPVESELLGPRLWHAHLTLDAARRGRGVALANGFLLGDDLETGRLVSVLMPSSQHSEIALGAYAFAARADRWHAATVSAFRRWLKNVASAGVPVVSAAVPPQPRPLVAA